MKVETILVPTDFSSHADKALEVAMGFARSFGARLVLFHAYDLGHWVDLYEVILPQQVEADLREAARRKLQARLERASAEGVDAEFDLALGTPSHAIVQRAKNGRIDLIVMGTRGLGMLKHVLMGSVAERTVRTAPCPVVTVQADSASRP